MKRLLPLIAAVVVLIFSGLVHGLWTERWGKSESLELAMDSIAGVPMTLGPWEGVVEAVEDSEFRRAGAQAYWVRQYTHRQKKVMITAILMCGRAGRMSVHTPQICFRGAGFEMTDKPAAYSVGGDEAGQLWSARFTKNNGSEDLRLYWGWNISGRWEAPDTPRWKYRGLPYLYKLYVIRDAGAYRGDDITPDFFAYLIPALQKSLYVENSR